MKYRIRTFAGYVWLYATGDTEFVPSHFNVGLYSWMPCISLKVFNRYISIYPIVSVS